jgi:hypothetical protein
MGPRYRADEDDRHGSMEAIRRAVKARSAASR